MTRRKADETMEQLRIMAGHMGMSTAVNDLGRVPLLTLDPDPHVRGWTLVVTYPDGRKVHVWPGQFFTNTKMYDALRLANGVLDMQRSLDTQWLVITTDDGEVIGVTYHATGAKAVDAAVDKAVELNLIDTDDEEAERGRLADLFGAENGYKVDKYHILIWHPEKKQ